MPLTRSQNHPPAVAHHILILAALLSVGLTGCFLFVPRSQNGASGRRGAGGSGAARDGRRDGPSNSENEALFKALSFKALRTCKVPSPGLERIISMEIKKFHRDCYQRRSRRYACREQELVFSEALRAGDKYRVTRLTMTIGYRISASMQASMKNEPSYRKHHKYYLRMKDLPSLKYYVYLSGVYVLLAGANVPDADLRKVRGKYRKTRATLSGGGLSLPIVTRHVGSRKGIGMPRPGWRKRRRPHNCPYYWLNAHAIGKRRAWARVLTADQVQLKTEGVTFEISKPLRKAMFQELKRRGINGDIVTFSPASKRRGKAYDNSNSNVRWFMRDYLRPFGTRTYREL